MHAVPQLKLLSREPDQAVYRTSLEILHRARIEARQPETHLFAPPLDDGPGPGSCLSGGGFLPVPSDSGRGRAIHLTGSCVSMSPLDATREQAKDISNGGVRRVGGRA